MMVGSTTVAFDDEGGNIGNLWLLLVLMAVSPFRAHPKVLVSRRLQKKKKLHNIECFFHSRVCLIDAFHNNALDGKQIAHMDQKYSIPKFLIP